MRRTPKAAIAKVVSDEYVNAGEIAKKLNVHVADVLTHVPEGYVVTLSEEVSLEDRLISSSRAVEPLRVGSIVKERDRRG